MIWAVKTYGKKPLLARLFRKKRGWIRLYVPFMDDWKNGY